MKHPGVLLFPLVVFLLGSCASFPAIDPASLQQSPAWEVVVHVPNDFKVESKLGLVNELLNAVLNKAYVDSVLARVPREEFGFMVQERTDSLLARIPLDVIDPSVLAVGLNRERTSRTLPAIPVLAWSNTEAQYRFMIDVVEWTMIVGPLEQVNGTMSDDFAHMKIGIQASLSSSDGRVVWHGYTKSLVPVEMAANFEQKDPLSYWDDALINALAPVQKHLQREVARLRRL